MSDFIIVCFGITYDPLEVAGTQIHFMRVIRSRNSLLRRMPALAFISSSIPFSRSSVIDTQPICAHPGAILRPPGALVQLFRRQSRGRLVGRKVNVSALSPASSTGHRKMTEVTEYRRQLERATLFHTPETKRAQGRRPLPGSADRREKCLFTGCGKRRPDTIGALI